MRARVSNVILGLFFVIAAIIWAGNEVFDWNFSIFFNGWWTFFIIIPAILSIVKTGFKIANSIFLILGLMLLGVNLFPAVFTWEIFRGLIFPVVLLVIGLGILFGRPLKNAAYKAAIENTKGQDYSAIFGSVNQRVINEEFQGADISAVFGGVELDLRGAIINQDVVINLTTVFGGADIFLPPNVKAKLSTVPIFGGASDKSIHSIDINAPTVFVNSVCVFGGVDIK